MLLTYYLLGVSLKTVPVEEKLKHLCDSVGHAQHGLEGEHKKYPPTTFVDISAVRGDFCLKFYRAVKQSNIHFIINFG